MGEDLLNLAPLLSFCGIAEGSTHGKGGPQNGCEQNSIHPEVMIETDQNKKEETNGISQSDESELPETGNEHHGDADGHRHRRSQEKGNCRRDADPEIFMKQICCKCRMNGHA